MIYNSRKEKEFTIDDVTFRVKPLSFSDQAEYMDKLIEGDTGDSKKFVSYVPVFKYLFKHVVLEINGLKDQEGNIISIGYNDRGEILDEFVEGFDIFFMNRFLDEMKKLNSISESDKKK